MRSLESYRGKDFIGVDELTSVAAALVERYRGEPDRTNVRLTITQRIVRHYLAEDLLGDPSGQSGTSIVFNYGNLLRLLAVKKLLADNWSLVKIREFMRTLDITALEQLINSAFSRAINPTQQQRSDELAARVRSPNLSAAARRSSADANPVTSLQAPSNKDDRQTPPMASLVIASARRAERRGSEWIEIATGLEIRVRRSFCIPRTEQERNKLLARFWTVVNKKQRD
jgi:hypothetical protein